MYKQRKKRRRDLFPNLILMLLISALYYVSTVETALTSIPASAPVYSTEDPKRVALQFTVSWNASALSGIMDLLKEKDIQVSFAVSGEYAEMAPELLRRMAAEGHELITMGYDPSFDGKAAEVRSDLESSLLRIEAVAGLRPGLYYPGARGKWASGRAAKALGLRQVHSTLDLLCAKGEASDILLRAEAIRGGNIVLLQPTGQLLTALPDLLSQLERKGLEIVPTGRLLE